MTYSIPQVQIQSDFLQVLKDNYDEETIWIRINDESFNIKIENSSLIYNLKDDIKIIKKNLKNDNNNIIYEINKFGIEKIILKFPIKYHNLIIKNNEFNQPNIICLSSIKNDKIMFGTSDGNIIKVNNNPLPLKINNYIFKKEAHFTYISKLISFKSGIMLLSCGLDMKIKIWKNDKFNSNFDLNPVRILDGKHKNRITDICTIGKGRNIISCGLDAKLIIWELGSGKSIWIGNRIKNLNDGYTSLCISKGGINGIDEDPFFECFGKIVWCGHKSGYISIWDLGTRLSLGEFQCNNENFSDENFSVENLDCIDGENIIVGLNNGDIIKFNYNKDLKLSKELWRTNIEKMEFLNSFINIKKIKIYLNSIIVLSDNYLVRLSFETGELENIFVGYDDTINSFSINDDILIATGKRGLILSFKL
ncbi:hypothetical protein C6P40_002683 [Pichia californica]|uniref:Uncharacterized protein n=1 Tax=Pichia californica TaxID=460514 RepID=A0A9P7BG32_9ASCO|nr:hypothetical protein C6P42_001676 [[Candida] californica]KAG0691292.1 hypothetical protein C6P40_002683 [[Candida] californica]